MRNLDDPITESCQPNLKQRPSYFLPHSSAKHFTTLQWLLLTSRRMFEKWDPFLGSFWEAANIAIHFFSISDLTFPQETSVLTRRTLRIRRKRGGTPHSDSDPCTHDITSADARPLYHDPGHQHTPGKEGPLSAWAARHTNFGKHVKVHSP